MKRSSSSSTVNSYYAATGTTPPRRFGFRWFDWLLLPLAAPYYVLRLAIPWYRRFGLIKLFLGLMLFWILYGALAVTFHDQFTDVPQAWVVDRKNNEYSIYYPICYRPKHYLEYGQWPFGKTYFWTINCTTALSHKMLTSVGLDDQAGWVVNQWRDTIWHYQMRSFSLAYIWLGVVFFLELLLVVPWAIGIGLVELVGHFRLSWN